jgi:SAM-dependent methyltransferase
VRLVTWIDRDLNYGRGAVEAYLRMKRGPRVILDLGAGQGDDLERARRVHPAAELHALECDPQKCRRLTARGFVVWQLDIERAQLPFASESVDVIIANQIFEHLKEIFWVFHEISRVLTMQGLLVLSAPNLASLHNRLLLLAGRQPTVLNLASAHVRGFTVPGLLHFLNTCFPGGYRMVARTGANFYPFPPAIAKPLARLLPGLAWGIVVALEKTRAYNDQFIRFVRQQQLETNFYVGEDWKTAK